MRYTTVIDITEMPAVYKNPNCRLVYLHMALRAGYHDHDRDLLDLSIRRISMQVGLTLSATRHALSVLERAQLITRVGTVYTIRKWIPEQPIGTRPKTVRQQRAINEAAERKRMEEQRELEASIEHQRRDNLEQQGKTGFMVYYEGLLEKAKTGDLEAQQLVQRHKSTYEAHKAMKSKS